MKTKHAKRCYNIEDEDIRTHFDNVGNESLSGGESGDDFTDVNFDDSFENESYTETESFCEQKLATDTYWFCRLLILWQCVNYISDVAVSLLLKLIAAFLMIMSTTSDTMKKYYILFPQNLYALSKIVKGNVEVCSVYQMFSFYDYSEFFTVVEGNRDTIIVHL